MTDSAIQTTTEVRTAEMGHACRRCGLYMHPQMMRAIFQRHSDDELWALVAWEHLNCPPTRIDYTLDPMAAPNPWALVDGDGNYIVKE